MRDKRRLSQPPPNFVHDSRVQQAQEVSGKTEDDLENSSKTKNSGLSGPAQNSKFFSLSGIFGRKERHSNWAPGFASKHNLRDSTHENPLPDARNSFEEVQPVDLNVPAGAMVNDSSWNCCGSGENSSGERRSRGKFVAVFIVGLVLVAVGAIVAVAVASAASEGESNGDFCADDAAVRELVRANFDDALATGATAARQFSQAIECLPSDVFGTLSADQLVELRATTSILFIRNGLVKVHRDAFASEGLEAVNSLTLALNGLSELPETLFEPLTNLETINLGSNAFTDIKGQIFNKNPNLETINLPRNPLLAVPEALKFTNAENINLANTLSLVSVAAGSFSSSVQSIDITQSGLLSVFLTPEEFIAAAGLANTISVTGFVAL